MNNVSRPGKRKRLLDEVRESASQVRESERRARLWFYQCIECGKFESDLQQAIQRCPQCGRAVQCYQLRDVGQALREDELGMVASKRASRLIDEYFFAKFKEAQSSKKQAQSREELNKWFREQEKIAWKYYELFPRCTGRSTWVKEWLETREFEDPAFSSKKELRARLARDEVQRVLPEMMLSSLATGAPAPAKEQADMSEPVTCFPILEGLEWKEVIITFITETAVEIKARNARKKYTYAEMGFKDGRCTEKPNMAWELLRQFAEGRGEKSWEDPPEETGRTNLQKKIQLLRKALKNFFKIQEDPFHPYRRTLSAAQQAVRDTQEFYRSRTILPGKRKRRGAYRTRFEISIR
jgi:hypothetical protein